MKCSKCGNEMFPNDVFCGVCGAKNPAHSIPDGDNEKKDRAAASGGSKMKIYIIIIASVAILLLGIAAALFGYILYGGVKEDTDAKATELAIASQEPDQATDIPDIAKYETYYVVNCQTSISLRKNPDGSAIIIADIPLGAPVSYVEPAQNGFAKIIYNGITGYALQSYLSSDPDDIHRYSQSINGKVNNNTNSNNNNGSVNIPPADSQKVTGAERNPGFKSYSDNEFKFSCAYPSHFAATSNSSKFVRRSYKASDGTATVNICATKNTNNLIAKTVQKNFKSSYPGTVDYENNGNDWCVCRTYKDGVYHYGYFSLKNGMIRGFEMHFDGAYYSIYDSYVNYIYDSLILN